MNFVKFYSAVPCKDERKNKLDSAGFSSKKSSSDVCDSTSHKDSSLKRFSSVDSQSQSESVKVSLTSGSQSEILSQTGAKRKVPDWMSCKKPMSKKMKANSLFKWLKDFFILNFYEGHFLGYLYSFYI